MNAHCIAFMAAVSLDFYPGSRALGTSKRRCSPTLQGRTSSTYCIVDLGEQAQRRASLVGAGLCMKKRFPWLSAYIFGKI